MTQREPSTVVCVLGASRSGTSLTARFLNLLGFHLGSAEDLLGGDLTHIPERDRDRARTANPDGFWEHYRLMRLNERILRRLGGNWREPPDLPSGWERSEDLDDLKVEAQALIAESFGGRALWSWKDPRNSLTLPFWQELVPDMRYAICFRDPAEVTDSLWRRDEIPPTDGERQWTRYMASALANSSGRRRLLVPFERYFRRPEAAVALLAAFTDREGALEGVDTSAVVDGELRRSRAGEPSRGGGRPSDAASLFRIAELLAVAAERGEEPSEEDELHRAADVHARAVLGRLTETAPGMAATRS